MDFYTFDDDYVRRLAEGDRATEEHFLHYFNELLLIKLRSRIKSMAAVDDIRQEVFLRVFRAIRSETGVRDGRKLGAFVNGVCNNVLHESFRVGSRTETLSNEHEDVIDPVVPVDEVLVTAETRRRVLRVLHDLPAKDAKILQEIFLEEKDKDEVCRTFGVDRAYLRVLLHRAKEKFRALYGAPPDVPPIKPHETDTGKPSLKG